MGEVLETPSQSEAGRPRFATAGGGLRAILRMPASATVDGDDPNRMAVHAAVLNRKPMLWEVFRECHLLMMALDQRYFGAAAGSRIELGAGVAPIRDTFPEVLATDVVPAPHLDRVLNAQALDLPDGSVRTLFGQNCFHHFPQPRLFFREALRVLAPGGGIILIEPYYGLLASFLFKRLFATEGFDRDMPGWEVPDGGPMNGANQALSYLVFVRDRAAFEQAFPELEIVHAEPLGNYPRYLLSGGLNFRQLIPTWLVPAVKTAEVLARPLRSLLAVHLVVVLRKRGG